MRFHKAGVTMWCDENRDNLEYIQTLWQKAYGPDTERGGSWRRRLPAPFWEISFGDRAGVFGAKLNGRVSCVKVFYDERIRAKVRTLTGLSRGRRAYRNGLRLAHLGIACPEMWGCIERKPIGPTMLVTELIDDGMRLDHWIIEHGVAREVTLAVAKFIRNMHDRGVSHTDLSPRNILVRRGEQCLEFLLLDYEDARFRKHTSRRVRLDDLHHLHERMFYSVPLRERLRFLRAYAGCDYLPFRNKLARMIKRERPRERRPAPPPQMSA